MFYAIARLELHLPAAQNLKDKRRVLSSLRARAHERAGMSFAEVEFNDLWQRSVVGFAKVYRDASGEEDFRQSLDKLTADGDYLVSGSAIKFEKFV